MKPRRDAVLVAAITLLALALRVVRLDFQPLWWDEGYSVWFAHQPLAEMIRLTALDIHPPLYYAFLGGWSQLFGLGPVALRLFSAAAGVLAIPLIYAVGRSLAGRRAGLLAAFLLAINPFHVYYSQEIRMYALVTLLGLAALGCAVGWLGVGEAERGREGEGARGRGGEAGWWAGYVAAMTLALYTQYYAAFLAAGLTVAGLVELWRRRAGIRRMSSWLSAQLLVAALYLPWVLYAAPRLVPYVSQKVETDADRPLGLVEYLVRHLSAYAAGHLEGPLAPWWPVGLLAILLIAYGGWRMACGGWRMANGHTPSAIRHPLRLAAARFLLITLAIILALGWLVNLTFPFFPDRGERLMLLGLPLFLLLVAVVGAGVWERGAGSKEQAAGSSESRSRAKRSGRAFGAAVVALFAVLAAVSLAAFYTVPRYPAEDYRPLIGQVMQWGRPEDTVFAVFPWQVGYFWSYGSPDGPQPVLSPADDWGPAVSTALDEALQRGHVWFPEHLSLGAFLENAAEAYLGQHSALLANRWYSPSTRLTGWAVASNALRQSAGPFSFDDGSRLAQIDAGPLPAVAANDALFIDLVWEGEAPAPRYLTARLVGSDGHTWAQQDYTLPGPAGTDALGLLVPSGTPPGQYDLRVGMLDAPGGAARQVSGPDGLAQGGEAQAGQVEVVAPEEPPSPTTLAFEQPQQSTLGDAVELLGLSATPGPLRPGDDLLVNLFWRALPGLASRSGDQLAFVQLLDAQGQVAAAWEGPPVAWHPTSDWRAGELVRSQHSVRLPATLPDGRYRLIAGLFDPATKERLASGARADFVTLDEVEVAGREHVMAAPQPQAALAAGLARLGRLVGYDLPAATVSPGKLLDVTLYWQATETTGERLAVFVHLVDAQGAIIGQSDGEPGNGSAPTSSWLPGEYLADPHRLAVRPDAPAGPARLVVGVYDRATGQRVPWVDAAGQTTGDSLQLPVEIQVESP